MHQLVRLLEHALPLLVFGVTQVRRHILLHAFLPFLALWVLQHLVHFRHHSVVLVIAASQACVSDVTPLFFLRTVALTVSLLCIVRLTRVAAGEPSCSGSSTLLRKCLAATPFCALLDLNSLVKLAAQEALFGAQMRLKVPDEDAAVAATACHLRVIVAPGQGVRGRQQVTLQPHVRLTRLDAVLTIDGRLQSHIPNVDFRMICVRRYNTSVERPRLEAVDISWVHEHFVHIESSRQALIVLLVSQSGRDDSSEAEDFGSISVTVFAINVRAKHETLMCYVNFSGDKERWLTAKPLLVVVPVEDGVLVSARAQVDLLAEAANLFLAGLSLLLSFGWYALSSGHHLGRLALHLRYLMAPAGARH